MITPTSSLRWREKLQTNSLHELLSFLFFLSLSRSISFTSAFSDYVIPVCIPILIENMMYLTIYWTIGRSPIYVRSSIYPPPRPLPPTEFIIIWSIEIVNFHVSQAFHPSIRSSLYLTIHPFVSLDYCQKRWLLHKSVNALRCHTHRYVHRIHSHIIHLHTHIPIGNCIIFDLRLIVAGSTVFNLMIIWNFTPKHTGPAPYKTHTHTHHRSHKLL